jgi:hypothetical protein
MNGQSSTFVNPSRTLFNQSLTLASRSPTLFERRKTLMPETAARIGPGMDSVVNPIPRFGGSQTVGWKGKGSRNFRPPLVENHPMIDCRSNRAGANHSISIMRHPHLATLKDV